MIKTSTYITKLKNQIKSTTFVFLFIWAFFAVTIPVASASEMEDTGVLMEDETLQNLDFEVRTLGSRRFMVNFNNNEATTAHVRIYDAIGNIVNQEVVAPKGRFNRQYDMSKSKSEMYIIEVGNSKYTSSKRVFLE